MSLVLNEEWVTVWNCMFVIISWLSAKDYLIVKSTDCTPFLKDKLFGLTTQFSFPWCCFLMELKIQVAISAVLWIFYKFCMHGITDYLLHFAQMCTTEHAECKTVWQSISITWPCFTSTIYSSVLLVKSATFYHHNLILIWTLFDQTATC